MTSNCTSIGTWLKIRFKERREIATRYAKRMDSYLASVQIRCIFCWLETF